jgi:CubicO group peptidase (beta-lactamase class C family)
MAPLPPAHASSAASARHRRPRAARRVGLLVVALAASGLVACSSDDGTEAGTSASTTAAAPPPTTAIGTADTTVSPVSPVSPVTPETPGTPETTDGIAVTPSTALDDTGETDDAAAIEATRAVFAAVGADDPGCTVAVGRDGEVVYAEAFGAAHLDPTEPMTTETIVDIGSTSKQFTATAILLLAEDGLVDLDDPLSTYLSDLPEWADTTTLRQLVHHTAGVPDYIELLVDRGFELTGTSTDADALAALAEVTELDFEPGTAWSYSNSNYFLMGQVVLAVTGSTLGEFLADEVFEPLDLAMVMDPVASLPGKATSYEGTGDDRTVADSRWEQLGDGGIQTTPTELVRWASEYWRPTIGGDRMLAARLDGAEALGDPSDPTAVYGAGIMSSEIPGIGTVLSHSGGWGGFVTFFAVVPDQQVAAASTCTSPDTLALVDAESDADLLTPWLADA